MNRTWRVAVTWLVGAHLGIAIVHGLAHLALGIPATLADNLFRYGVVGTLPVIACVLLYRNQRGGTLLLALTMGAACLYGALNHFIFGGLDHVAAPNGSFWQMVFDVTAVLLFASELACTMLGGWLASRTPLSIRR